MRVEDREVENVGESLQVRDAEERVNEMKGRRVIHERLKRESACGKTESKISKKDDSLKESRQESLDRARDVSGAANDESNR